MSILLYGYSTCMLTERIEKKLDGNYTRMLRAILNKSWKQHPTKQQLYGLLLPISKTIQIRRTKHWRSKNTHINNVPQWTPSHGWAGVGRPARTYLQQFCANTGCGLEDQPNRMDDIDDWRERERESGEPVLVEWHKDEIDGHWSRRKKSLISNLLNSSWRIDLVSHRAR